MYQLSHVTESFDLTASQSLTDVKYALYRFKWKAYHFKPILLLCSKVNFVTDLFDFYIVVGNFLMWSFIFQGLMWKLTKNWASEVSCDCFSQSWIMHTLHWQKSVSQETFPSHFQWTELWLHRRGKNIPVERQAGLGWRILLGNCFLISVDWENLHV